MRPLQSAPVLAAILLSFATGMQFNNVSLFEFFDCRCGERCLLTLPKNTRPPDYSSLNQCLEEKGFRTRGKALRQAVQSGDQSLERYPLATSGKPVIKFGFLIEVKYPFILGAISLAVEHINNSTEILPNVELQFIFERIYKRTIDVKYDAIMRMTEMRDRGVLAFIGSSFSCESEALVAAAWNLPMIAFQCSGCEMSNKTVYPTFARTLPPSVKIAKSVIAVLEHYKWNRVVVMTETSTIYRPINEAFQQLAKKSNIAVNATRTFGPNYLSTVERNRKSLNESIDATKDVTRIYVFFGDSSALLDFVMLLAFRGMLDLEYEYFVLAADVAVDLGSSDEDESFCNRYLDPNWSFREYYNIEDVHLAFRSVHLVVPKHQDARTHLQYREMVDQIFHKSTEAPFCEPFHPMLKSAPVPIEAAFMYDAVLLYAIAAHRVLAQGGDLTNGTEVIDQILNRTYFSTLQNANITIDDNGDSEGDYIVLAMIDLIDEMSSKCPGSSSLMTMGDFENNGATFVPHERSKSVLWPKGKGMAYATKSEPLCGFENERCTDIVRHPVFISSLILLVFMVAIGMGFVWRQYRYEQKLAQLLWKLDFREIKDVQPLFSHQENLTRSDSVDVRLNQLRVNSITNSSISAFPHENHEAQIVKDPTSNAGEEDNEFLHVAAPFAATRSMSPSTATVPNFSGLGRRCGRFSDQSRSRIQIGYYRGNLVAIKRIFKKTVDLKRRTILKELNSMRELRHDNLVPFLGACVGDQHICIVTPFCSRGSLQDVLDNEDFYRLDNMFVASLVADLLRGMVYLHDSEISYHGRLKSSNCLVDTRWVLQISDFGLRKFKAGEDRDVDSLQNQQRLLWQAPELLRLQTFVEKCGFHQIKINFPFSVNGLKKAADEEGLIGEDVLELFGTQKADVYAFGVILHEIFGRQGPWGNKSMTEVEIQDIVSQVLDPKKERRPPMDVVEDCENYVKDCMIDCWKEDPERRPDFRTIRQTLRPMHTGLKPNIFDNMLSIMEKYATNLESQVAERTHLLMEEKKKTDALLYSMLPRSVADSLKQGHPVQAESFDCVTIYFSDVVGFTALSAASTPMEVVMLLNDLYTCFDSIIEHYDVYKIETIGDAYMVVSGLPLPNGKQHAGEIASLALELLTNIKTFRIRHKPEERILLRIGVHSGPVVAGVVGRKMPRYCLFGDTVNTASRMESTGDALKIHMSHNTQELLDEIGGFEFFERGPVYVKGKGEMKTFFLIGKDEEAANCLPKRNHSTYVGGSGVGGGGGSGRRRHRMGRNLSEQQDIFDLIQDIPAASQHSPQKRFWHGGHLTPPPPKETPKESSLFYVSSDQNITVKPALDANEKQSQADSPKRIQSATIDSGIEMAQFSSMDAA